MSCCSASGCQEFFNEQVARRDIRRYRKKGLDSAAERIVEFLKRRGVAGRSVLEVGGGVGAIQLELLRAGAARTVSVELSPAYQAAARELLGSADLEGRVEFHVLDFAERSAEIEPADSVVMNRVVCCYPDYETLVRAAAEKARRHLVLSFPRDAWWVRLGIRVANLLLRLRGGSFRAHLHPPERILAVARASGLEPVLDERRLVWQLAALERPGVASVS
jgi:2-polyprenyl-3-methyl-5-hydroxy-6-metoxy-1,4-benzoquinol methylase